MNADFRTALVERAKLSVGAAPHCQTEEAAKLSLIMPFVDFLGYDSRNPAEVTPEHACDFSDKYRNRVDFAIMLDGVPVIAIECKGVGGAKVDDRGQLKAYFNAARSVKLGVLSDGLVWEFYADSDEPNLMDNDAFLVLDLRKVAEGQIADQVLEGLAQLRKGSFNPENIGAEAKRKLIFDSFVQQIGNQMTAPTAALSRMLLEGAGMKGVRSARIAEYQDLVHLAFKAVTDSTILQRLDIKPKEEPKPAEPMPSPKVPEAQPTPSVVDMALFEWVQRRLAFLVKDEALFAAIGRLEHRSYASKLVIHLGGERKGRILEFAEAAGAWRFVFGNGIVAETRDLQTLDEPLLASFLAVTP